MNDGHRDLILLALRHAGAPQTGAQIGVPTHRLQKLADEGFLTYVGRLKVTPGPGRRGHAFKLADKGRKRAATLDYRQKRAAA